MNRMNALTCLLFLGWVSSGLTVPVAVEVVPVTAPHGMVVAGHPQAAQIGVEVLRRGGNAIDAAVAVSLALGVAEPHASGLGGKLMLLYYEAATGRTYALDAMDAAGSLDVATYLQRPDDDHYLGYGAVCVPGLAAGLWAAHQRWGILPWADTVVPAVELAVGGFVVVPKIRDAFFEQEKKLRQGDAEIARLYLPGGGLPAEGSLLPNADLARTLQHIARDGRDGFYLGPVADALVTAMQAGGGVLTHDDLANYEVRWIEPIGIDFRGYRLVSAPPPTHGAPLFLTILKVLEDDPWAQGPLRSAARLDRIGRIWREVLPLVQRGIADAPEAVFNFEKMVAPDSIAAIRAKVRADELPMAEVAGLDASGWFEDAQAATTHFLVADAQGNLVCATQSLSFHFGAGVVAPGTGVVLNNSMSNFAFRDTGSINYLAPGKRPRSTIAPTLVLREGRPVFALGVPGSSRIPTALLQVLLDRLAFHRPLTDAIGDTRVHWYRPWERGQPDAIEAEQSLDEDVVRELRARGWVLELREPAGTGRHFGGVNAVTVNPDGSLTGIADPRRANAAAGY
jgi:gamma-glutamyltranspeptidase/glutathione hydrolase